MKSCVTLLFFLLLIGCNQQKKETVTIPESNSTLEIKKESTESTEVDVSVKEKDNGVDEYLAKLKSDQAKRDSIIAQLDTLYWEVDSIISVIGIIQSSGIIDSDNLGVEAEYQLTNPLKNFFLQTDEDLSPFWGYCVKISGRYLDGWNYDAGEERKNFKFGRTAIRVESVELASNELCNNSPIFIPVSENSFEKHQRDSVYSCYIQRRRRPAPDISYDYEAILSKPIDLNYEEFSVIEQLPLTINIDLETLNDIIENNREVRVYGIITGGYAEGIVLKCKEFIGLN